MIEFGREALFEARVLGRGIGSTNIASNNLSGPAQSSERPLKICNREAAGFPIRHCLARVETVKIDGNVNVFSAGRFQKLLKVLAPIIAQDRAPALLIFRGTIVCPGMDFQSACTFGPTIAENLVRPPALEVSATPDTYSAHI